MKTLTVRLPETLVAEIEAESRERRRSKSDIVRERLGASSKKLLPGELPDIIADVVGAVNDLPPDMSERVKHYLKIGYGGKRPR